MPLGAPDRHQSWADPRRQASYREQVAVVTRDLENAIYDAIDPHRALASHAYEALASADTMPLVWSFILDLAELSAHDLQR
jgi:hypothetical protein